MTYCAGWKYADNVYLIADTAVSKSAPLYSAKSSFGEQHAKVRADNVEESLLKLVPIASHAAVAFAGDVQLATEIIDFLKNNYQSNTTGLFSSLQINLGPFDENRAVTLLFASSHPDAGPSLIRWDTVRGVEPNVSDFYDIGSLDSYHAGLTTAIQFYLAQRRLEPTRMLAMVLALVQSYGNYDNLIDKNVGGIIFGLRVHAGGVSWQEDTHFLLYGDSFSDASSVSAYVRGDALIADSTITNMIRMFSHSVSNPDHQEWLRQWEPVIQSRTWLTSCRYWIFLSKAARVITIIRRERPEPESKYMRPTGSGDNFDLAVSNLLKQILFEPLSDRKDGSIPYRMTFLNDAKNN